MSILKLKGNDSGTGTVTLEAPNTNTDQTISIPDGAGSFVTANASGDVAVTGTFTSQGIDDNATSTALTIDSSENVLVGTTTRTNLSNGTGNTGHSLDNSGQARHTSDSSEVMFLNRLTDDGDITVFRKDGTTVGSIAAHSGRIAIGSGDTGIQFISGNDAILPVDPSTPANRDGAITLGWSDVRFKDLYLYGGVYLGGIGSANLLDDYETGTWTPVYKSSSGSHPTITYSIQVGVYVKIGDMVHVQGRVRTDAVSGGGGFVELQGLPFTNTSPSNAYSVLSIGYCTDWTNTNFPSTGFLQTNNTAVRLIKFNTSEPRGQRNLGINVADLNTTAGDNDILFSMTYKTD